MAFNIDDFPRWMKTDLTPCPNCKKPVLLFYDEGERYRIRCSNCGFQKGFRANSMEKAKNIWNERNNEND